MAVEQPSLLRHSELLVSSEARTKRAAQKLGDLSLGFGKKLRGRKRPEFEGPDRLLEPPPDTISINLIKALGKKLGKEKDPLFDQFTRHNRFGLSEVSLRDYCRAESSRRKQMPTDPNEAAEAKRADQRQPFNIRDKVQQGLFDDRNIARLRRGSLAAVQHAIRNDMPFDEAAVVNAADAIVDFGYCLHDNPYHIRHMGKEEFAINIAHIGNAAKEDPDVLRQNPDLVRLVQIEQAKRVQYWGDRFDLTVEVFAPQHLTQQNRSDGERVDTEAARLDALCQA